MPSVMARSYVGLLVGNDAVGAHLQGWFPAAAHGKYMTAPDHARAHHMEER